VSSAQMLALLGPVLRRLECEDVAGWTNPFGKTCADYATPLPAAPRGDSSREAGGWCEAGALKREAAWAGGVAFGWPEKSCCACGGGTGGGGMTGRQGEGGRRAS
jgi:hypothetical protein